jgi:anaerobic magnesium-protoporphyrin IX monomethyl ester cyclase
MAVPDILLIGADIEENLGTRYLAAALRKAGFDARLVGFTHVDQMEAVIGEVLAEPPPVVGLSLAFQHRAVEFLDLIARLRQTGYAGHVTVGGHFATFEWQNLLNDVPGIDSVVLFEGEETVVDLVRRVTDSAAGRDSRRVLDVAGLGVRGADGAPLRTAARPLVRDLDRLAPPARDTAPIEHLGLKSAAILASRGCYGSCNFCCINAWYRASGGPHYRARSPENVADEMAWLRRHRGVRVFNFHDDNFFLPTVRQSAARIHALGDAMRARGLDDVALLIKARPDDLDPDLFAYLKDLGLVRLFMGIENASEGGLQTLGRRCSVEDIHRALSILEDLDLFLMFNVLIFDPYSTWRQIEENVAFLSECDRYPYKICRTEVYTGTPLHERLAAEGRLEGSYLGWDYTIADRRVELLFRLTAVALGMRSYDLLSLTHFNVDMGYYGALAARFYPGPDADALREHISDFNRRLNIDTLSLFRRAMDYARTADPTDAAGARRVAAELATDANRADLQFWTEFEALERELKRIAQAASPRDAGSPGLTTSRRNPWRLQSGRNCP